MSEMSKELKDRYLDEANKHAHFLTEKVFKPAFIMAFIHGAKHGRDDLLKELESEEKLNIQKEKNEVPILHLETLKRMLETIRTERGFV